MKKFIALFIVLSAGLSSFAVTYDDITLPKPPAYRTGLSEQPEKEYMEAQAQDKVHQEYVRKDAEQFDVNDLTFADLSIKQISREVAADLELDQEDMVGDLSVLWQGAASQSDTKNFALNKLPQSQVCLLLREPEWEILYLQRDQLSAEMSSGLCRRIQRL